MNARQRHIVLVLKEWWVQNGKAPSAWQLVKASGCSQTTIYDEMRELSNMGMVRYEKLEGSRADYQLVDAMLTPRAESLLPRIKELE